MSLTRNAPSPVNTAELTLFAIDNYDALRRIGIMSTDAHRRVESALIAMFPEIDAEVTIRPIVESVVRVRWQEEVARAIQRERNEAIGIVEVF